MTERSEAKGISGIYKWDDESAHDDVTKIYVQYSPKGIHSIRFDYVKSGKPSDGSFHGKSYNTCTQTVHDDLRYFTYFSFCFICAKIIFYACDKIL